MAKKGEKNKPKNSKTNSQAYTYYVGPIGSNESEEHRTHETSPSWVLTFVRWAVRDTLRTKPTQTSNFSTTRYKDPLVVENDCIQVSTSMSKSVLTDSVTATLLMTDVNYETDVAPGDFMFVNMLNWESESRRVADKARAHQAINGPNDGFKGLYKVQSVRKNLIVDPNTGTKMYVFKITGFSFTEFNNTIYFNPALIDDAETKNLLLFASNIGNNWKLLQNEKGLTNVQELVRALIESFIGTGFGNSGQQDKNGTVKSANTLFYMPELVGTLLGATGVKAAKDIYNYMFGIQSYSSNANQKPSVGLNPSNFTNSGGRFWTPNKGQYCQGDVITKPEYWNQTKVWSILNQFTNAPLNELYTSFRLSPDNRVMPTLVFRQIPFTTSDFDAQNVMTTRFMSLPRWKISSTLITGLDIGRDEAARVNFVQYYARSTLGPKGWEISAETAQKNYLYDIDDVKRSGLRPYVISTTFDESVPEGKQAYRSVNWARIIGDCLIGGHLKMNGTITCAGIVDPIAVGDNLEFDGVVYHIEGLNHTAMVGPDGKKTFRTSITLSSGVSKDSSAKGTRYSEMTQAAANDLRNVDYKNNQILPGVSESQDVVYRKNSLDIPVSKGGPFAQPNNGASIGNSGIENQYNEKDKK